MEQALKLIFAALIAPLVEAINNLATVVAKNNGGCTAAPAEAPAETTAPAKRGPKPKAPAADEALAIVVTMEDIKAHVASLDDSTKDKLKAYVVKTFKKQSLAELDDAERAALLKVLIEKGATDTRKKAPEPEGDGW